MFKRYFIILALLLVTSVSADAQWRYRFLHRHGSSTPEETSAVVKQYGDSLTLLRARIDSMTVTDRDKDDVATARLFLPLAYYNDIARDMFTPGHVADDEETTLLSLYMNRPDLVTTTERRLRDVDEHASDVVAPIHHDADLTDKLAPNPPEPETAPVTLMLKKPNFWTIKGDYSLQFMQNYISGNWYKGGESNYSALAAVTMEANYNNKQKVKWDNKLELKFGLQSTRSDSLHSFKTTEDLFRLTSKLGLQATKKWYYTLQFLAYSQFTHGYKANDPKVYSDFLAPLTLNVSLGMDYTVDWINHKLKGTFHLAPLAYNMKYTRLLDLSKRLGIDEGHHVLNDFGSEFTIDLTWQLLEQLQWKTRLYGYTSYERAELEWENTFTLKFNRWISAQLFIYPRFDDGVDRDDHHGYWQFKEYASVGFMYSF